MCVVLSSVTVLDGAFGGTTPNDVKSSIGLFLSKVYDRIFK